MGNATDNDKFAHLASQLEERYPGVFVDVIFNDHSGHYKGWHLSFQAEDPQLLIGYGLANGVAAFESGAGGISEWAGCRWHGRGIIDASKRSAIGYHIAMEGRTDRRPDRALSKKMQAQVSRLLKPFVKGTWKAPAVRQS